MVCNVIEECRCYSYTGEKEQFCGVRKGPYVLPCPTDCCAGGCPDDGSRQPFRFIDKPDFVALNNRRFVFLIWLFVTIMSIYYFRNLKITPVRKI
jgi:hypothetical protein|tara:strand:+ start:106 stop:390 length:285 start_codon:yes stop_codon:yes gene_type:complete